MLLLFILFYHLHSSFVEARKHYYDYPEDYEDEPMTQIRDAFKVKGSVAHDVGAMPKGNPLVPQGFTLNASSGHLSAVGTLFVIDSMFFSSIAIRIS